MTLQIGFVLIVLLFMTISLVAEFARPEIIIFFSMAILILTGVLTPDEALQGFSNQEIITIALLFIIAGAIQQSGILGVVFKKLLKKDIRPSQNIIRLMLPISAISAFMNNTPIVVMLMPEIRKWCQKNQYPVSKLLIPLSYATIFGGMVTLIGTSTNLVVQGMLIAHGLPGMSMFELTVIGLPAAIIGILYMAFVGYWILPNNKDVEESAAEASREIDKLVNSNNDYHVISRNWYRLIGSQKPKIIVGTLLMTILLAGSQLVSMFNAALLGVLILFVTKAITFQDMRQFIPFNILLLIASSFGIGYAISSTGTADFLVNQFFLLFGGGLDGIWIVIIVYLITNILTQVIANSAVAALMFPIVLSLSQHSSVSLMALVLTMTVAASASFAIPIGYQTNLIVYGPGRYKFVDFLKVGIPLSLLYMIVTVSVVALIWLR